MADETVTSDSGAFGTGTSCDGVILEQTAPAGVAFATLIAGTGTLAATDMGGLGGNAGTLQVLLRAGTTSNQYDVCILPGLTFDVPSLSGLTAVKLRLYGNAAADSNPLGGDFDMHVVNFTPASNNTLVAADYQQFDTTSKASIAYGSLNASGWNEFTLAVGDVTAGQVNRYGVVFGDYTTGTFTGSWILSNVSSWSFDSAEGTNPPELVITHAGGEDAVKAGLVTSTVGRIVLGMA